MRRRRRKGGRRDGDRAWKEKLREEDNLTQEKQHFFFSEHFHEVDEWQLLCHWLDGILLSSPPACCLEQAGRRGSRNRQSFRRRRGSHHRSVDHYSSLALVHGGVKHKQHVERQAWGQNTTYYYNSPLLDRMMLLCDKRIWAFTTKSERNVNKASGTRSALTVKVTGESVRDPPWRSVSSQRQRVSPGPVCGQLGGWMTMADHRVFVVEPRHLPKTSLAPYY